MSENTVTTDQPVSAGAVVLGPGEGTSVWFLNNRATIKATAASTGGAYGLLESTIPTGFSPPLHVHHLEDEAFWIIEGTLTIRCGTQICRAEAGAFAFLPRGIPHTFVVESHTAARVLTLISPGGGEGFFVAAGRTPDHDGMPLATPIDRERLARAAALFSMELVGPPMQRSSDAP